MPPAAYGPRQRALELGTAVGFESRSSLRAVWWASSRRAGRSKPAPEVSDRARAAAPVAPAAVVPPSPMVHATKEPDGRPRLRYWLDRLIADKILEAAVVYGYFPAYSEGNTLVVLDENGISRSAQFTRRIPRLSPHQ